MRFGLDGVGERKNVKVMSDEFEPQIQQAQRILFMHKRATAEFRAELAERSEAEVKYDECLLSHLRKGKAFKIALRKANKKFPEEALNPDPESSEVAEEHYRFFLRMTALDEKCREIEWRLGEVRKADQKIADIDNTISKVIDQIGNRKTSGEISEGTPSQRGD